ncbi:hypothetical protein GCM10010441_13350 [Kitasatospora paracochleata]|uniref:Uncharacterized protein (DUF3084 family) n=1 Tax=Kitasatospora paracochleata TaxID=58354 RepID=A0ABT1JAU7_9ACTN|nr:hypothetical protein [Kitasatospora paracochleata]MCP2314565.1 uncharacterized protein (DUF3084 family) [Kitasatospora paracochleata]
MILVLGLIVLIAAAVVALAGIFTNTGAAHDLTNTFTLFGHHITGSTGTLFLLGIIVGAAAMLGLGLLLTGARRTSRRGATARHELRDSRRETAAATQDRDALAEQRDTARTEAATLADDRNAREQDTLAEQRDDLAEQRDAIALQRIDLMRGQSGAHEQTAGTRTGPMLQDDGTPPGPDATPNGDGHRRPHLISRESESH